MVSLGGEEFLEHDDVFVGEVEVCTPSVGEPLECRSGEEADVRHVVLVTPAGESVSIENQLGHQTQVASRFQLCPEALPMLQVFHHLDKFVMNAVKT